jgi:glycosyltransferase involved in cell wall biosynthesis
VSLTVIVAHNFYRSALPSGENTVVRQEMRWLAEAGVRVIPYVKSSDEISGAQKLTLPVRPVWSPQGELEQLIERFQPDVLHLHNPYPLLSPAVIRTAHGREVPVVQTVHNYRHVCVSGLYFRDGHECHDCQGRVFGLPAVEHACYRGSRAQSLVMATSLAVNRKLWRTVDRFIAPSSVIVDHLLDYGISRDRIVIKPNAIDDPGEPTPAGAGALFAGRLDEAKGIRQLLDAWKPEYGVLRVAGDGPLKALVRDRDGVDYLGNLGRSQVRQAIRDSALVIVPSQVQDVHPTIVIEGLANGRPVLGTQRGGIPEMIGPAGWVSDDLARTLPEALSGAHSLVKTARQRYLGLFSPDATISQLIGIYTGMSRDK